ncbi:cobalt-factor II C(20)-methyltransferase [Acidianus sulfidivorans JP7]|uniref:Cobalt-factor II C(20)-methyltransferase n=1 Tax=Acidianus sulfidivorans JP7 TaxID=619593 RepID=A0A2U9IJY9_9CREN|nr:cobalt-factor II C(20)-methyltransferase [Acidianus sulfidivorans]AWR96330.1 cobalt-factor II C(20)-methyltransferase [Acidianus sulfidivorans JP7]
MTKKLYVVGLGPGDPELITIKAYNIIKKSKLIFVPYSTGTNRSLSEEIIKKYASENVDIEYLGFPMKKEVEEEKLSELGSEMCKKLEEFNDGVFVTLGDPTLYSTFFRVKDFMKCDYEFELIPGVSSITACASKAKISLGLKNEKIALITAGDFSINDIINYDTVIIFKANENLKYILDSLRNAGFNKIIFAKRCFMNGEEILFNPSIEENKDYFSTIIARRDNNGE